MYKINNSNFEIDNATVAAVVTNDRKFKWAIDLYAIESEFEKEKVAPKFSFIDLEEADEFKFNESFNWKSASAYDKIEERWIGDFYIFDAHYFECEVNMIRLSEIEFMLTVKGKVNLNPQTYPTTWFVPFEIKQKANFNGVISELEDEKESRIIASKFIATDNLIWKDKLIEENLSENWLV